MRTLAQPNFHFQSYKALLEEEIEDQQQKDDPENKPKPPPIYINYVKNISHSYSC
jgi:hypothetical protein